MTAENVALRGQMRKILVRSEELEGQLAKDTRAKLKQPSSEGSMHKLHNQHKPCDRKS